MEIWEALAIVITERYRRRSWSPGETFPSLTELCRTFGVSRTTAVRVVKKLEHNATIVFSPDDRRYHFHGIPATPEKPTPDAISQRYLQIARELENEIEVGVYSATAKLPDTKTLQTRFDCHHLTVAKALGVLEHEGLVRRSGRAYRLSPSADPDAGSCARVYVAAYKRYVNLLKPPMIAFMGAVEDELRALGWPASRAFIVDDPLSCTPPRSSDVAGYIHVTYGKETPWNRFFSIQGALPLVVVDLSEQYQPQIRTAPYCTIKPDNIHAARTVALHLKSTGHRNVAFFCHVSPRYNWVKLRLDGLREVYSGHGRRLTLFSLPLAGPSAEGSYTPASARLKFGGRDVREILPAYFVSCTLNNYEELGAMDSLERKLRPLFIDALDQRQTISAWVCANDSLALLAYRFLQSKGIEIGREIAVCGFDALPHTHPLEISSYDFDLASFGHAAVRRLSTKSLGKENSSMRIHGRLLVRGSTERFQAR